jgi:hypothetical protein
MGACTSRVLRGSFLNFRTAYCNNDGTFEIDPKKIRNRYCSFWFPIDLVASFPFDWVQKLRGAGSSRTSYVTKHH